MADYVRTDSDNGGRYISRDQESARDDGPGFIGYEMSQQERSALRPERATMIELVSRLAPGLSVESSRSQVLGA